MLLKTTDNFKFQFTTKKCINIDRLISDDGSILFVLFLIQELFAVDPGMKYGKIP
jgi:hypothetical protein